MFVIKIFVIEEICIKKLLSKTFCYEKKFCHKKIFVTEKNFCLKDFLSIVLSDGR